MIAKSRKTRIGNKIRIQSDLTNFQIHFLDYFHDFCEFRLKNDQIRTESILNLVLTSHCQMKTLKWLHWQL